MTSSESVVAKPSATVIILRERESGIQVLMVQKNAKLNYGGNWVFPGGMLEPGDLGYSQLEQARAAAVRETHEETGLSLTITNLVPFSHWVTPLGLAKRYAAWFFLTHLERNQTVNIDQQEIVDSVWIEPCTALHQHATGQMQLNGPAFVSLINLSEYRTVEHALEATSTQETEMYVPRGFQTDEGFITLFADDDGYDLPPEQATGLTKNRHRTLMYRDKPWQYLRDNKPSKAESIKP